MNKLLSALLAGIALASVSAPGSAQTPAPVGTQSTDRTVPGTGTIERGIINHIPSPRVGF